MIISGKINSNLKSAIRFFADSLISKQLQRHISIKISVINNAVNYGEVEVADYNLSNKPRDFILFLDKNMSEEEKIKTLAHEFCHIKQILYNELNEEMTLWKGKKVCEEDYQKYEDRPWEKEAYTIEKLLYEEYINETRNTQ